MCPHVVQKQVIFVRRKGSKYGRIDFAVVINRAAYVWRYSPAAAMYTLLALEAALQTHLGTTALSDAEASGSSNLPAAPLFKMWV